MGAYLLFEGKELHLDAVLTEQAEHQVTATEHVVEEGADVADHVRPGLDRFTIEGVVSNTPTLSRGVWPKTPVENLYGGSVEGVELDPLTGRQKATGHSDKPKGPFPVSPGALFQVIGNAVSSLFGEDAPSKATVLKFSGAPFDAVRDTLNTLLDWQARAVLGSVVTPHREYQSMIIERVSPSRDSSTGASAKITIDFREVRLVETQTIAAPIPTEIRGKKIVQKGKQPTTPVTLQDPLKALGIDKRPDESVAHALARHYGWKK